MRCAFFCTSQRVDVGITWGNQIRWMDEGGSGWLNMKITVRVFSTGWLQTSVLLCTADRPGHHAGHRQAAHPERNLQSHHQELPVLQDCRQGLAGELRRVPSCWRTLREPHSWTFSAAAADVVAELDPSQPVAEPLLHQGGAVTGGAGQRLLLEDRPVLGEQAYWAGLQETKAPGCPLLQDPTRTHVLQVGPTQTRWLCSLFLLVVSVKFSSLVWFILRAEFSFFEVMMQPKTSHSGFQEGTLWKMWIKPEFSDLKILINLCPVEFVTKIDKIFHR